MGSKVERQTLGDVQPQGQRRKSHSDEESRDRQCAALLENADKSRDQEEVGEGFHNQNVPRPPAPRKQGFMPTALRNGTFHDK